jgi:hypothetical protein
MSCTLTSISPYFLSTGNLKDLKHDVNTLKQISDLRVAATVKDKKHQFNLHGNAERRAARKELRKLAESEMKIDVAQQKKMQDEEQAEMTQLMKLKISDTAQPSLLAAARFLVQDYAVRLPNEKCQACQKNVIPENPILGSKLAGSKSEGSKKEAGQKAMRTYCGHWLHHNCLNEWLTTPPFIRYLFISFLFRIFLHICFRILIYF